SAAPPAGCNGQCDRHAPSQSGFGRTLRSEVRRRHGRAVPRRQPMSPQTNDAPVLAGTWGVGNVIQLRLYPKHSTRTATDKPAARPRRVRVFLGANGPSQAAEWAAMHGRGTALALLDGQDPAHVPWPKGA